MTGRHPFVELRAKMSPKARERAVAKAKRLRREMDLAELRRRLSFRNSSSPKSCM
jgi:hypothetical protein